METKKQSIVEISPELKEAAQLIFKANNLIQSYHKHNPEIHNGIWDDIFSIDNNLNNSIYRISNIVGVDFIDKIYTIKNNILKMENSIQYDDAGQKMTQKFKSFKFVVDFKEAKIFAEFDFKKQNISLTDYQTIYNEFAELDKRLNIN